MAQLALAGLCSACLLSAAFMTPRRHLSKTAFAAIWGIALLAGGAILTAPSVSHALRELCLLLGLVAIALVIASNNSCAKNDVKLMMFVSVVVSALYGGLVLGIATIAIANGWPYTPEELFFGYANHRFYSHVQTVALPLSALATSTSPNRSTLNRWAWFALITGFALLVVGAGRATAVGLFFAATLCIGLFGRRAWRFTSHLAVGATLGVLIAAILSFGAPMVVAETLPVSSSRALSNLQSDHSRFYLWRIALEYIEMHPWFGIGPMHLAHHPNLKGAHPHNMYLQIAAEWGLPFLLAILLVSGSWLKRVYISINTCSDREQASVGIGLFAACVAVAIDAAFSGNLVMPVSQVWIAFLIGWTQAWQRSNFAGATTQRPVEQSRLPLVGSGLLIVGSQVWLLWSLWPEVRDLNSHLAHVRDVLKSVPGSKPRLWSNGWF